MVGVVGGEVDDDADEEDQEGVGDAAEGGAG